jgi:hypothetical protein
VAQLHGRLRDDDDDDDEFGCHKTMNWCLRGIIGGIPSAR